MHSAPPLTRPQVEEASGVKETDCDDGLGARGEEGAGKRRERLVLLAAGSCGRGCRGLRRLAGRAGAEDVPPCSRQALREALHGAGLTASGSFAARSRIGMV